MRLIDADYVQRKAANTFNVNRATLGEESMLWRFQQIVDEAPTVQAEPVVRCNNCKYGQYEEWDNGECVDKTVYCDGYGIHKPDWFCADGERREE